MLTALTLGCASIAASFSLGMYSAGSVQPVSLIEAGSMDVSGDIDHSGSLDIRDVRLILEVVESYREFSLEYLAADFDGDGLLTAKDALRAIVIIESR